MSIIANLAPDQALASLLENKISIALSAEENKVVPTYRQNGRPNTDSEDEFVEVLYNGTIQSVTKPFGMFRGNLAVVIYCRAFSDGTAKFNRMQSILAQIESLAHCQEFNGVYFEVDSNNLITPISYDPETGYSILVLNVGWHTTA